MTTTQKPALEVVAWTEKHTMAAIRATASFGTVELTREHGPYDIDRPSFKCDRLVEAIVAARDVHWQAALQAQAAEKDAEIAALRERVIWAMDNMGTRDTGTAFISHVLRRGGTGDFDDCATFIDSALLAAKEAK